MQCLRDVWVTISVLDSSPHVKFLQTYLQPYLYYDIHCNIHYDTRDYYDTIITLLWHIMTGYWHPVSQNVQTESFDLNTWK